MGGWSPVPSGLDYYPVPGDNPDLGFGVIRTTLAGVTNTAPGAVFRRLFPIAKPASQDGPWPRPTCFKHDVLLPPHAAVDYVDPEVLIRAYEVQAWEGVKDLLVITTFRFPEAVAAKPTVTLHEAWELTRSFAYQRFVIDRSCAVILVMHVPSRSAQSHAPHLHLLAPARVVGALGFGAFLGPLTSDKGREIMEREWKTWRLEAGV